MKKHIFIFLFVGFCILGFSQSNNQKSIFSIDTGYLAKGLKNNGWGIGFTYERELYQGIAVKGGFSHMTMWNTNPKIITTSVGISGDILYYPFRKGLNWLYLGLENKTEFYMYIGNSIKDENNQDTIISLYPLVGWKQSFFDIVLLDIFCGYNFVISKTQQQEIILSTKNGFEYGIKVKVDLIELYKKIIK